MPLTPFSFYNGLTPDNTATDIPMDAILNGLLGAPGVGASAKGATTAILKTNTGLVTQLQNFLTRMVPPAGSSQVAAINWILFDERFNFLKAGSSPVGMSGSVKDHKRDLTYIPITQNGYFYVYVSNQSNLNAYFPARLAI